jgi:hypothetical protein
MKHPMSIRFFFAPLPLNSSICKFVLLSPISDQN